MNRTEWLENLKTRWTTVEETILTRRSCRNFKPEQVPEFMVRRILEAGRFAPSAGNGQPWKFVVLRDPAIIDGITKTVVRRCRGLRAVLDYRRPGRGWLRPLAEIAIRCRPNELSPVPFGAVSLIAEGRLGLFHGAPTVIVIFKDRRGISNPDLDCGIAGQNMVLAAHSLGLATCWISFAKLAFKYGGGWKKRLGLGFPYQFASSLALGWPLGQPDGLVPRPTVAVDWHESGRCTVVF
jgi:nitroreductase